MQQNWRTFLLDQNAVIENNQVVHFGDLLEELKYTQTNTVFVDLSHYGLLRFTGEDAQTFLQNQFSCDIRDVNPQQGQYGSYCTPKGRVLANFVVLQKDDEWLIQCPADLCLSIQKRLTMFVLRSKVVISDCSEQWVRIGVVGAQACELVKAAAGAELDAGEGSPLRVIHTSEASIICHATDRLEIIASEADARQLWQFLSENARPVSTTCWHRQEIRAGIPIITMATQEQFLPQMINLDLIGGVSFNKGCYPGQEIVARTQYLGKLKRRMYLVHVVTSEAVVAGDAIFCADSRDQSCGTIVNAVSSPDGGYDALAVIQQSSVDTGCIYLHKLDGPELRIGTLPYTLD